MEGLKSRAVALIVCIALILVGWFGGNAIQNMGGNLVTTEASGLKSDAVVMQVGTVDVTADEYLYWLTSVCDSMYQYYGITDWTMMMTENMTVGQAAKEEAGYYASQYAAIRQLAQEHGVEITEEQQTALDGVYDYWCNVYGGKEVCDYMLAHSGLNQEMLVENNVPPFLYANLCGQLLAKGGELEPTEANLKAYAERTKQTNLAHEELLKAYMDPGYGATYDYIDHYMSGLEIKKSELYDKIDVAVYYPAVMEARAKLAVPDVPDPSDTPNVPVLDTQEDSSAE